MIKRMKIQTFLHFNCVEINSTILIFPHTNHPHTPHTNPPTHTQALSPIHPRHHLLKPLLSFWELGLWLCYSFFLLHSFLVSPATPSHPHPPAPSPPLSSLPVSFLVSFPVSSLLSRSEERRVGKECRSRWS